MSMFDVVKESSRSLGATIHRFDEGLRSFILSVDRDDDSDEEKDGEFSKYKTVARNAFASPTALANRLGKRGGVDSASCSRSGASSRRCKDQYKSDPNASKILKEISSATSIRPGKQSLSLQSDETANRDEDVHPAFADNHDVDSDCAEHSFHSDDTTIQSNKAKSGAQY